MTEKPCLHCALWRTISEFNTAHPRVCVVDAVAEVAADLLAAAPQDGLVEAKLRFGLSVASKTATKRRRAADRQHAGATLQ
jgi:hypothetical protein